MAGTELDIESRNNMSLAVANYLRSIDHFDMASQALTKACSELRARIDGEGRFVVEVECRHYLVTSDREGNFEVEQIESL